MGVIFNNLRVGGLGAGDREFEEGRELGAASAQLGSWHNAWTFGRRCLSGKGSGEGAYGPKMGWFWR